jgi:hypothetical protein
LGCTCETNPEALRFGEDPQCPHHGYEAVIQHLRVENERLQERLGEAEETLDEMRVELAGAEQVLVAADRLREAYEAMPEGRDLGRLPDWQSRGAFDETEATA